MCSELCACAAEAVLRTAAKTHRPPGGLTFDTDEEVAGQEDWEVGGGALGHAPLRQRVAGRRLRVARGARQQAPGGGGGGGVGVGGWVWGCVGGGGGGGPNQRTGVRRAAVACYHLSMGKCCASGSDGPWRSLGREQWGGGVGDSVGGADLGHLGGLAVAAGDAHAGQRRHLLERARVRAGGQGSGGGAGRGGAGASGTRERGQGRQPYHRRRPAGLWCGCTATKAHAGEGLHNRGQAQAGAHPQQLLEDRPRMCGWRRQRHRLPAAPRPLPALT